MNESLWMPILKAAGFREAPASPDYEHKLEPVPGMEFSKDVRALEFFTDGDELWMRSEIKIGNKTKMSDSKIVVSPS